jgi:hypothetical protein
LATVAAILRMIRGRDRMAVSHFKCKMYVWLVVTWGRQLEASCIYKIYLQAQAQTYKRKLYLPKVVLPGHRYVRPGQMPMPTIMRNR